MNHKTVRTIADIARLAGVSKSTASRALNDSPLISTETKDRIRAIAEEHQYRIHIPARNLSLQQSHTIAFVTHSYVCRPQGGYSLEDIFLLEILGAVSSTLTNHNYDLLMVSVDPQDLEWVNRYLGTGRVDGFILLTSTHKPTHIQALVKSQAPFIIWGPPPPDASYCSVRGDNLAGGRLAVEHLIRTGRKRIAFLGGPRQEIEVSDRYKGYAAGLRAAGLAVDPALVSYGWFSIASATERMKKLLEAVPDLDAVFANSDLMASQAIRILQQSGRRVPEDVAVMGYDDLSLAAVNQPAITTIRQNIPLAGQLLAKNLLQYLQNGLVTNVTLPSELIIRESA